MDSPELTKPPRLFPPADAGEVPLQPKGKAATQPDAWHPRKELILTPAGSCIRSGHLLFVGGLDGWDPRQRPEPGDIRIQVRHVLETMKSILEGAGSSMQHVLNVRMTVADPNTNLPALNEVYVECFPDPPPVRSFSGASAGHMGRDGVLCQLSCIAYVD
jgi:enamine deaminase RidA (YjgF/YER057c/UK114 family)